MADDEKKEEKRKKKSLLMPIIAGLLLIVIAGGGYFFLFSGDNGGSKTESIKQTTETYYPLKTFIVNLSGNQGSRYLKVAMQFGITNPTLAQELNANSVVMRDAIISILSSKSFDDISSEQGKDSLKLQIKNSINKELKTGKIDDVYFSQFVVQ